MAFTMGRTVTKMVRTIAAFRIFVLQQLKGETGLGLKVRGNGAG